MTMDFLAVVVFLELSARAALTSRDAIVVRSTEAEVRRRGLGASSRVR